MNVEAKWLDILKATGPQTTAIAAACGFFLLLPNWGIISPLEPWETHLVVLALLTCGFLSIASMVTAAYNFLPAHRWLFHAINNWRLQQQVRAYIPFMTENDRKIISYLLEKKQKQFEAASDGGYAVGLISRGIILPAAQHGQIVREDDVPFHIPDPIWNVLWEKKDQFPYSPEYDDTGRCETHPWRVPWMLQ